MGAAIDLSTLGTLLDPRQADFERKKVADILNRRQMTFPGAQPVSFARKHFQELQRADYFLCEKTDGIRCLLFCTQYFEDGQPIEMHFLIDRKNDYYYLPTNALHFPLPGPDITAFHTQTLLDGELVLDTLPSGQQKLFYLIFDCLALDSQSITDRTLDIRLGKVTNFVMKPYDELFKRYPEELEHVPFRVQLKSMEMPYGLNMMFKDILPKLPHGNDGLIFTCMTTPYVSGTDPHILKWKPPHENTVDFRLQMGDFPIDEDGEEDFDAKPPFELLIFHGNEGNKVFGQLALTDDEWKAMKALGQQLDGRIIECYQDSATSTWRPKIEHDTHAPRFRDDKKEANHISVAQSVLDSIDDMVTEDDLIANAGVIRTKWKQRAVEKEARRAEEKRRMQHHHQQQHQQRGQAVAPPPQAQPEVDDGPQYSD